MKKKDIVKCLPALNDDSIMSEYISGIVITVRIYFAWNYAIFHVKTGLQEENHSEINLPVIICLKIVNGSHFDYNQNILQQNLNFFFAVHVTQPW